MAVSYLNLLSAGIASMNYHTWTLKYLYMQVVKSVTIGLGPVDMEDQLYINTLL